MSPPNTSPPDTQAPYQTWLTCSAALPQLPLMAQDLELLTPPVAGEVLAVLAVVVVDWWGNASAPHLTPLTLRV